MSPLIPLIAAIAPFIIWPIELFLPYPYIIEEGVKALFVLFAFNLPKPAQIKIVLASAIMFTLSETVLYIFNIALVGDFSTLITRFILTALLHSLTILIILISTFRYKWFMPAGVIIAMLIHYFYNLEVNILFSNPTRSSIF